MKFFRDDFRDDFHDDFHDDFFPNWIAPLIRGLGNLLKLRVLQRKTDGEKEKRRGALARPEYPPSVSFLSFFLRISTIGMIKGLLSFLGAPRAVRLQGQRGELVLVKESKSALASVHPTSATGETRDCKTVIGRNGKMTLCDRAFFDIVSSQTLSVGDNANASNDQIQSHTS